MNDSTAIANLQLKFKGIQTGGKGSIRRKRIPGNRNKKSTETEEILNILKMPKEIKDSCKQYLTPDNLKECNRYLKIFTDEFCNVISKGHRKSNRPSIDHHMTIKKNLTSYLVIQANEINEFGFHENLSNYSTKNLSHLALKQLKVLLDALKIIIETKEYLGYFFNVIPNSDSKLAELYSTLKIDFSVKMVPTNLRTHYLTKVKELEVNDTNSHNKLKYAYFSVLKLLTQDDSNHELDALLKDSPEL